MATLAHLVLSLVAALALTGHPATLDNRLAAHHPGRLPAGIHEVDARFPSGRVRARTQGKVSRIVRWFDRLATVQPGIFNCPALVRGPTIDLVFRGARGVLARASFAADSVGHSLVSAQCTPVSFSVRGHRETALVGGRFLLRGRRLVVAKPR